MICTLNRIGRSCKVDVEGRSRSNEYVVSPVQLLDVISAPHGRDRMLPPRRHDYNRD